MVLFDVKETDEENHKNYIGVSLQPIINNLNVVNKMQIPFLVRLSIIPKLNDRKEHFLKVKEMTESMQFCCGVEIMPYHKLGKYKYELLQRTYRCAGINEPDKNTLERWQSYLNT